MKDRMQSISHTAYMREPKTKNLRWSLLCIPVVLKYMYVNTNSRSTGYILSICSELIFLYINPSLQRVFFLSTPMWRKSFLTVEKFV